MQGTWRDDDLTALDLRVVVDVPELHGDRFAGDRLVEEFPERRDAGHNGLSGGAKADELYGVSDSNSPRQDAHGHASGSSFDVVSGLDHHFERPILEAIRCCAAVQSPDELFD